MGDVGDVGEAWSLRPGHATWESGSSVAADDVPAGNAILRDKEWKGIRLRMPCQWVVLECSSAKYRDPCEQPLFASCSQPNIYSGETGSDTSIVTRDHIPRIGVKTLGSHCAHRGIFRHRLKRGLPRSLSKDGHLYVRERKGSRVTLKRVHTTSSRKNSLRYPAQFVQLSGTHWMPPKAR